MGKRTKKRQRREGFLDRISIRIPEVLLSRIDKVAEFRACTRTSIILFCLKQKIEELEKEI